MLEHRPVTPATDALTERPVTESPARFDVASASAEGWGVFDCGLREDGTLRVEIQRIDCPDDNGPAFAEDHDAWLHVVERARAGSALHQQALRLTDPIERMLIEASCGWWPDRSRRS